MSSTTSNSFGGNSSQRAPRLGTKTHFPLLDLARFVAALGIIWLHIDGNSSLDWAKRMGRFAVPFFAASATFLAANTVWRRPNLTIAKYAKDRFVRIYFLFLAWSVIYWAARSASHMVFEHSGFLRISAVDLLWNGTGVQLWFLPFILVATVLAFALGKLLVGQETLRFTASAVVASIGLLAALRPLPESWRVMGYAIGLSYYTAPAACWAFSLAMILEERDRTQPHFSIRTCVPIFFPLISRTWRSDACHLCSHGVDGLSTRRWPLDYSGECRGLWNNHHRIVSASDDSQSTVFPARSSFLGHFLGSCFNRRVLTACTQADWH